MALALVLGACGSSGTSTADVEKEVSRQALASVDTHGADVKMDVTCAKQSEHTYRCKVEPVVSDVRAGAENVTATVDGDKVVVDGLDAR